MRRNKVCIIGAGPCGLTVIKNLLDQGIEDFVCHESLHRSGGLWNHTTDTAKPSVYASAHIISSKRLSVYRGFPMPDSYPDYPSHEQILAYLDSYASAHDLTRHIRFGSTVTSARPIDGGGWTIVSSSDEGETSEIADTLIVCNGHHTNPVVPQLDGTFSGEQLHSIHFRDVQPFAGKRVLVVGGGNSACDIAASLSRVASDVSISMRNPHHIMPKLMMGRTVDWQYAKLQAFPRFLHPALAKIGLKLAVGPYSKYGLARPTGSVLSMHPTLNTDILDRFRHGKVTPRRGISRADGETVAFQDGTEASFDTIIWATGYRINFPFFSEGYPGWENSMEVPLYLKMMPADRDDLFYIGLIQPMGCIWALADYQAGLAAASIAGRWNRPADMPEQINKQVARDAKRYERSERHAVQVDFHEYKRELEAELSNCT